MISNSLDPVISIGTLAKKVNLSVSAIRKYEDEGLIISHRSDSGHRLFSYEDIERINTIHHLIKDLGFNIEGIRRMQAILPCWNLLPCKKEVRDNCLAYMGSTKPCWMIKDAHCTLQGNECRMCSVYRFGTLHTEGIRELVHSDDNVNEQRENINKIVNR
jgi:MerR family transcriptional regulator/heat shock protein HspR